MFVIRTEKFHIIENDRLSEHCHYSKNLWNEANYYIRQEFFKTGKWIRYNELDKYFNRNSENYKLLNSKVAQQTLSSLNEAWSSTFEAIKEKKINPDKFKGNIKFPKYKEKDGKYILTFTNQSAKIRDGFLTLTKKLPLKLKTRLHSQTDVREVRIIPQGVGYTCEIVYQTLSEEAVISKRWYARRQCKNRIIGIDLGTRNAVTIANNIGDIPIVVKGGILKSINQFYNKNLARVRSIYDKQKISSGKALLKLTSKRNFKIKDQLHKLSKFILNFCRQNKIETIVIGYNENWKQEVNLGKKNNQNFVNIPYRKLIEMLNYKLKDVGFNVLLEPEAYTSKCSFLDNETIEAHEEYLGKRISRGLFRSANGTIINADVNGALNIIRKAIPDAFTKGIEGVGLHPVRLNYLKTNSYNL